MGIRLEYQIGRIEQSRQKVPRSFIVSDKVKARIGRIGGIPNTMSTIVLKENVELMSRVVGIRKVL